MCRKKKAADFFFFLNLRNHFPLFISTISTLLELKCVLSSLFFFRDKAKHADFEAVKPERLFILRVGGKDLQHINKLVKDWKEGNGRVFTVIEGMENRFGDQDEKPKRVYGLLVLHWLFGGKKQHRSQCCWWEIENSPDHFSASLGFMVVKGNTSTEGDKQILVDMAVQ